jgi:LacI family transcriptional regulator
MAKKVPKQRPGRSDPERSLPFVEERLERPQNLVHQVEKLLREAISAGRFPTGKLPIEVELADQLGVSRETVRRATESLADAGLLVKYRRRGTFLAEPQMKLPPAAESRTLGYLQADYQWAQGHHEPVTRYIAGLMLQGALDAADDAGYELAVRRTLPEKLGERFKELNERNRLRGVIFASIAEEKLLRKVVGSDLPSILLDHDLHLPNLGCVRDDSKSAARMALAHLAELGHRRIAIAHWHQANLNPWRLEGYREGLRELGLPRRRKWEIMTPLSEQGARDVVETLKNLSPQPTALFCFNNSFAREVIDALGHGGFRVPEDISVVGGGGEEVPGLTCHQADWYKIGRTAVEMLLRAVESPGRRKTEVQLAPHVLRIGNTTAAPAD